MTGEIVAQTKGKTVRFILGWRGERINFGKAIFGEDGSFYFSSAFHNDVESNPVVEWGISRLAGNQFVHEQITSTERNQKGMHFSLHPRGQVMNVREQSNGRVFFKRQLEWFPVVKPFNLLHVFSLPLKVCKKTTRTSGLIMDIPKEYEKSVELIVDLFPRDTKVHYPYKSIWVNWGICPNYLVRASFNLSNQITPALVFWPENNILEL